MPIEYTIDKSAWPEGPWQTEPDHVQWVDLVSGYPCEIKRHLSLGHLYGYVLADKIIPNAENQINVHGGITLAEDMRYGFDCSHAWDFCPGMDALHDAIGVSRPTLIQETYRDIPYCIQQCTLLARQLWELS